MSLGSNSQVFVPAALAMAPRTVSRIMPCSAYHCRGCRNDLTSKLLFATRKQLVFSSNHGLPFPLTDRGACLLFCPSIAQ